MNINIVIEKNIENMKKIRQIKFFLIFLLYFYRLHTLLLFLSKKHIFFLLEFNFVNVIIIKDL